MPTSITGSSATAVSITGNTSISTPTVNMTGGNTFAVATTAIVRAWANVYTASTATCSFNGFNITSVTLVSTGRWDVTFTNAGYADVNSIVVTSTIDTNYNVSFGYDRGNSTTSKVRLTCVINNGTAYTLGYYSVGFMW